MDFYKYHGAGNDFILIDNIKDEIPEKDKQELAEKLCHRRFGIGGNGLILVEDSVVADVKMRIFNPDGSEPEMCGNGIRCLAKYFYDHITDKKKASFETLAGLKKVEITPKDEKVAYVKVDMGIPMFERKDIPAIGNGKLLGEKLKVNGEEVEIYGINTGVPHVVVLLEVMEKADIVKIGRAIRYDSLFPEGTNVNFLQKIGENVFRIRTYERGVEDETLACGTGIVASGVIATVIGEANSGKQIEIRAKGGIIYVEKRKKNWFMSGPAEFVFRGEI
jgi:diaminopimelate epimerase